MSKANEMKTGDRGSRKGFKDAELFNVNQHTPTPWKLSSHSENICIIGDTKPAEDNRGGTQSLNICDFPKRWRVTRNEETDIANAEFIVRAVNSHEELVRDLKLAVELIRALSPKSVPVEFIEDIIKAEGK